MKFSKDVLNRKNLANFIIVSDTIALHLHYAYSAIKIMSFFTIKIFKCHIR